VSAAVAAAGWQATEPQPEKLVDWLGVLGAPQRPRSAAKAKAKLGGGVGDDDDGDGDSDDDNVMDDDDDNMIVDSDVAVAGKPAATAKPAAPPAPPRKAKRKLDFTSDRPASVVKKPRSSDAAAAAAADDDGGAEYVQPLKEQPSKEEERAIVVLDVPHIEPTYLIVDETRFACPLVPPGTPDDADLPACLRDAPPDTILEITGPRHVMGLTFLPGGSRLVLNGVTYHVDLATLREIVVLTLPAKIAALCSHSSL
jgi:hypothetical protein